MTGVTAEWVALSDKLALVSRETGESWLLEIDPSTDMGPFGRPMTGKGAPASTAALLDGAIALGLGDEDGFLPDTSLPRYVFWLVGAYHNSRRTPGHFRQAAERFRQIDRPDLASYLETHAREEMGHDRLVLKDLRALSLPAERIVANLVPEGVNTLCKVFDRFASSDYPVACIGYSYCFERTAAMKQLSDVEAFETLWPESVDASRFLRTHSGIGSEVSHVEEMVEFIAGLPASDRIAIVKATYETAVTMAAGLRRHARVSNSEIVACIQAAAGERIRFGPGEPSCAG